MKTSRQIVWWEPRMGEAEKKKIAEVIDRGFPNDGEYTREFEKKVAALCGMPYAVAVTSGTAALFLALAACGIGPGDEVIVPDITFIATANAVRLAGANPVLADVDENTLLLDPESVRSRITAKTRAVIPVHVSGRAASLEYLLSIARRHHLRVIEDAAEAFGSFHSGKALGSIGDLGCFSFTANKIITTGQGGMVLVQDPALHDRLRELKDQGRRLRGTGGADEHHALGYNFKFTDLQAAMGLAQLEDLPARQAGLKRIYEGYRTRLDGVKGIRLPGFDLPGGEVPLWIDAVSERRDSLCGFLAEQGIPCRLFWKPLHTQPPYRQDDRGFPVSARLGREAFWLPSAFSLTDADIEFISTQIRHWSAKA